MTEETKSQIEGIGWRDLLIRNILKKGVRVIPTNTDYLLTIVSVELDENNLADSMIKYRMEPKHKGRRFGTCRAWWILDNTNVVEVGQEGGSELTIDMIIGDNQATWERYFKVGNVKELKTILGFVEQQGISPYEVIISLDTNDLEVLEGIEKKIISEGINRDKGAS